jgi:hypothetical protein
MDKLSTVFIRRRVSNTQQPDLPDEDKRSKVASIQG